MRKIIGITAALITAAALTGCGDSPTIQTGTTPDPVATISQGQPTPPPPAAGAAAVEAYMEALGAFDSPRTMRSGLDQAVEGSTAYVYLAHRANLAEAGLDSGIPLPALIVSRAGSGFELCDPDGDADGCSVFDDFEVVDGRVNSFTIDGTDPGPRLVSGNGETVSNRGAEVEFLTAYQAISGDELQVTLRVTSGSEELVLFPGSATYRSPDGRQREATHAFSPTHLGPDSTVTAALLFSGVDPGGTVKLEGWAGDSLDDFMVEVRVG